MNPEDISIERNHIRQLYSAIKKTISDDELAREIAFNLGDIKEELKEILFLLDKSVAEDSLTKEQLQRIHTVMCIHWKYHIDLLSKAIVAAIDK